MSSKMPKSSKTILLYKARNLLGSSGGIEKVFVWLANGLADNGYDVHIATRDTHYADFFFPLNKKIKFKHFNPQFSKLKHFIGKLSGERIACCNRELHYSKMIRQYCDKIKPDVIIATGVKDLQDIVYDNPYNCRKILQLHMAPEYLLQNSSDKLLKVINKADVVQVLLPSFADKIKPYVKGDIVVIGNPVEKNDIKTKKEKIIIYPARIETAKQQHLLIEAFAKVAKKYPDWQVHFYGAVSDKKYFAKCQGLIEQNNLQKQVLFKGVTNQMAEKLAQASICGFVSAQEGFGLGLAEAMASGLPCVGFKSSSGVNELIKHNKNGYLADDIKDLAKYLGRLIDDGKLRDKLGNQARKDIAQFNPQTILMQWEELING